MGSLAQKQQARKRFPSPGLLPFMIHTASVMRRGAAEDAAQPVPFRKTGNRGAPAVPLAGWPHDPCLIPREAA